MKKEIPTNENDVVEILTKTDSSSKVMMTALDDVMDILENHRLGALEYGLDEASRARSIETRALANRHVYRIFDASNPIAREVLRRGLLDSDATVRDAATYSIDRIVDAGLQAWMVDENDNIQPPPGGA